MTATFDNTVSILVKAFLKDTLRATDCAACACGNIIAETYGRAIGTIKKGTSLYQFDNGKPVRTYWQRAVWKDGDSCDIQQGVEEIAAAGYSVADFVKIEDAFMAESAAVFAGDPEDTLAGLMAVVDVLAEIHGVDLATATAAKELFVKA